MATSPIYSWPEPDNTDLVRNGALAIRTLGNAIDTTMATMTPKSIVDAKGDLIAATANDTPARLAVGSNGQILVADSSTTTGLRWQNDFAAGKNKIINGDFGIWQRGTSFTLATLPSYGAADRFLYWHNGSTAGTNTVSRETFTPGAAPVAGYESQFFQRVTTTTLGTSQTVFDSWQRVEDVRTFAGQSVTFSLWAKSSNSRNLTLEVAQNFGSGGSAQVTTTILSATATTSSWVRYSGTITMPSVSGKTIGANSYLNMTIRFSTVVAGETYDIWGVQLEAGSVATAFQTASGSIAGELALAQRYYWRTNAATAYAPHGQGGFVSAVLVNINLVNPVPMRVAPTSLDSSNITIYTLADVNFAVTALTLTGAVKSALISRVGATVAGGTANTGAVLTNDNNAAGYVGLSAEL